MTTYTKEEAKIALDKAKISLMAKADSAFFTTICFSLIHAFDDSVPTAATNGMKIKYNTKFFMDLDNEERIFVILHETMHCAYVHRARLTERCHGKWNIACDHVINLQLKDRGFKVGDRWHADPKFTGMSADQVYDLLPDNPGKPMMQDLEPGDEASDAAVQQAMADVLVRAAIQSKLSQDKPGTIPGDIEIFLDRLLNPKLPWNRILQKYLQNFAKNDYSFRKPNRRFFPQYHLPSLYSETLMDIAIAVDTSGSVSDADFLRFVSETASILKMVKPEKITLIQFDNSIKSIDKIRNIQDLMKIKFSGRGGTWIAPVIEWCNTNKPQLLLTFSDGEFDFPDMDIKFNPLWIIHNNESFTAPKGKVIHYTI